MQHLTTISRQSAPRTAMALLEKQAMTDMIQRNLSQIAVFVNVISGLKPEEA